ncbi:hypothetical protein PDESU_05358 [Pontiella desulfatans]|uniref:PIN domain-containing protein n=1 Tax=Pontiella desulfatans TaxID=2750659 RepID=A0A6C2UBX2_PONDE|nr:hypothetical protein PDESU_05358 [Pontiella desulfatans]
MRVVIDTNVAMSAIFFGGVPRTLKPIRIMICSGDKHLLNVNGYKGIEVLKPKPFSDKYLKAK